MKSDWTVIWLLNIIGFVAAHKVKIYGLDIHFDHSSNVTIVGKTTWKGKPDFHTGKLVIDPNAHTVEANVIANNAELFQLNGTFERNNDKIMVKGFVSSKFFTVPIKLFITEQNRDTFKIKYYLPTADGTLEVSLDPMNPKLKLTPKNGHPMELSGKHKKSNNQWLVELFGKYGNTKLEGNAALDIHNLHKMKGTVNIAEGSAKKFDFHMNTVDLPHLLEIYPASKVGIPTSRSLTTKRADTLFLEGDYKLWKNLNINSNFKKFSSFKIDTMRNNMIRVEFNHKELFQQISAPEYPKTNKHYTVKAPLILPLGDAGGYELNIATDNPRKNTVNLELKLGEEDSITINWDTSNLSNMMLKAEMYRDIEQP